MKRTGFKRKPHSPFSSLTRTATLKRQKAIVKRIKRPTVAEGSKYLAACRGEPCFLRVPGVCRLNPLDETVVPCHSNQSRHGKAGAMKARNELRFPVASRVTRGSIRTGSARRSRPSSMCGIGHMRNGSRYGLERWEKQIASEDVG